MAANVKPVPHPLTQAPVMTEIARMAQKNGMVVNVLLYLFQNLVVQIIQRRILTQQRPAMMAVVFFHVQIQVLVMMAIVQMV